MDKYNEFIWSKYTDTELRTKMYDTELLDRERKLARRELVRRTHTQKIDDTLGRLITIKRARS